MVQREACKGDSTTDVVILTHAAIEGNVTRAISAIEEPKSERQGCDVAQGRAQLDDGEF